MFGYEGESNVWLCCRMSDGSVRSLGAVFGNKVDYDYHFEFSPNPLPTTVTSPDQIGFAFIDTHAPDAPFPIIEVEPQVGNFEISEGSADYDIELFAEGVRVSNKAMLISGDASPLVLPSLD